jgi:exoribonuclease-2
MAIFPKGSSKLTSGKEPSVDPLLGSFAQYEDNAAVILAVVVSTKKDKLGILNIRGRELELAASRLYLLPGKEPVGASGQAARVEAIKALQARIDAEADKLNVEELWAFVCEEARAFSVSELCKSYFGSDEVAQHAGMRVALIREKIHFKREKDFFEPRPTHVVEDLRRAEEARRKKAAVRDATIEFLSQRLRDSSMPVPLEAQDNILLMEEVAAGIQHSDPGRQKEGRELVHAACDALSIAQHGNIEKQAFELLEKVGFFHRDTNLSLIRHSIPLSFDSESAEESRAYEPAQAVDTLPPHEKGFREDLTRLHAITIDDSSTKDMDDAITLDRSRDGWTLGIHITDVSCAVLPETHLDRVARRRATSLYCADQTINMLPEELSDLKLSLRQGEVRLCISVILQLNSSLEVVHSEVLPSCIRVAQRLSYDDVDRLLEEGDSTLLTLHEIAAACEARRISSGAMRVHKREAVPFKESDGSIRLLEIDEDSPARILVSEMMVLANQVMAEFAAKHHIPVLFRGQERPQDSAPAGQQEAPEGPAKDFSARTKLKKSTVTFEPQWHAGLGLAAYIQATSPIRRYLDLCHQRQFVSYLRSGKPWATRAELEEIFHEVEAHLQAATVASRETRRYWLMRYLEQRERAKPIVGTVVRLDLKTPLVELDEAYLTIFARVPKGTRIGAQLSFRISSIDPRGDTIRIEALA